MQKKRKSETGKSGAGFLTIKGQAERIRRAIVFLVPGAGIEPARWIPPRDFKSLASTNSATQAQNSGELQVRHSQASTPCTDKHPNCQDWTAWAYLVIRIRICGHFLKSNGLPLNSMSRNHIGFDQIVQRHVF